MEGAPLPLLVPPQGYLHSGGLSQSGFSLVHYDSRTWQSGHRVRVVDTGRGREAKGEGGMSSLHQF